MKLCDFCLLYKNENDGQPYTPYNICLDAFIKLPAPYTPLIAAIFAVSKTITDYNYPPSMINIPLYWICTNCKQHYLSAQRDSHNVVADIKYDPWIPEENFYTKPAICDLCNNVIKKADGYLFYSEGTIILSNTDNTNTTNETGNMFLCEQCTDKIINNDNWMRNNHEHFDIKSTDMTEIKEALFYGHSASIIGLCKQRGLSPKKAKSKARELALLWWYDQKRAQIKSKAFWKLGKRFRENNWWEFWRPNGVETYICSVESNIKFILTGEIRLIKEEVIIQSDKFLGKSELDQLAKLEGVERARYRSKNAKALEDARLDIHIVELGITQNMAPILPTSITEDKICLLKKMMIQKNQNHIPSQTAIWCLAAQFEILNLMSNHSIWHSNPAQYISAIEIYEYLEKNIVN